MSSLEATNGPTPGARCRGRSPHSWRCCSSSPIDAIVLPVHLPVNGTLDRPVVIALTMLWFASLAVVSGAARPRLKFSRVHFAALAFLAVCLISVALNGHALASMDDLTLTVKKLALLISYIVFFFIVASVLHPREVARFATLMVVLGTITSPSAPSSSTASTTTCSTRYRGMLLPVTAPVQLDTIDSIGRLTVYGPTLQPLELAAMLAMVLPFTMPVGSIDAATQRGASYTRSRSACCSQAEWRPRARRVWLCRLARDPDADRLPSSRGAAHGGQAGRGARRAGALRRPRGTGLGDQPAQPGHINSALTTTDRTARYDAVAGTSTCG